MANYAPGLGKELDVQLFEALLEIFDEFSVPNVLEYYRFITESEFDAINERMSKNNAGSIFIGYVKRANLEYCNANNV